MKITDTIVKMRAAMDKQNATRTVMRILESRKERTNLTMIYKCEIWHVVWVDKVAFMIV